MDVKRAGAVPWTMIAVLAGGAVAAPGLSAQEVDSITDAEQEEGLRLGLLVGVRVELGDPQSPGYSADLVLDLPMVPIWLSLQFLAQVVRWGGNRDHHHLRRVRLGYGKHQGPMFYGLFEKGGGVVKRSSILTRPGDTFDLEGIGLGGGTSFGRFTASLEVVAASIPCSAAPLGQPVAHRSSP